MMKWTILPVTALLLAGCAGNDDSSDSTWMGGTSTTTSQQAGTATSDTTSTTGASQLSQQDQKFMTEAAAGGLAEVQMGKLAAEKGQSASVKALGQKMVQDHAKANQELRQIAAQKGITLPSQPAAEHKGALEHLKGLQGEEFDKAFTQHAVQDHQEHVQKFQTAAQQLQDTELKSFAAKTLPTLKQHLQLAQQAQSQATGATGTESGTTTGSESTPLPTQQPQ